MIQEAYKKYGLPIWLTETGAADVTAWHAPQLSTPTAEMADAYVKKLLGILERLPFVERYAWFADRVGNEYALGTILDLKASRITPLGEIYQNGAG